GEEEVLTGSLGMTTLRYVLLPGVGNQMRVWLCDGFTLAPVEAFCGTLQHSRKKPARVSGPRRAPVLHQLVRTLDSSLQGSSVSHDMEDRGADRSESRPLHCISPGLRGMAVTATALT
ncbi:hypothetical protein JOQ06_023896, partial [Pogonophryne albipinna]